MPKKSMFIQIRRVVMTQVEVDGFQAWWAGRAQPIVQMEKMSHIMRLYELNRKIHDGIIHRQKITFLDYENLVFEALGIYPGKGVKGNSFIKSNYFAFYIFKIWCRYAPQSSFKILPQLSSYSDCRIMHGINLISAFRLKWRMSNYCVCVCGRENMRKWLSLK